MGPPVSKLPDDERLVQLSDGDYRPLSNLSEFLRDRIQLNSVLIVLCFVSVLVLESQSAASYPTYLLALAMLVSFREWNDVFRQRLVMFLVALLGFLALTSFWSQPFAWRDVASTFVRVLLVFCFVAAFAECQMRGELRRWLGRTIAVCGTLAVIAALMVFYSSPPEDGRLNGLGQLDTHVVAALVYGVVLLFLLDVVMTDSAPAWRAVALVGTVVIAYAIFLSDSRNTWVSTIIGVGVFVLAHKVRDPERFVAAVAALGVILFTVILALILNEGTRDILLPRGDSFRLAIWGQVVADVSRTGLWFGHGINTADNVMAEGMEFLHPHNMYLSVVYQGGLFALALLVLVLSVALSSLFRNYHNEDAKLALGVLSIALPAYMLDGHELVDKVGATWFLFWLPIGISLGFTLTRPLRERRVSAPQPAPRKS